VGGGGGHPRMLSVFSHPLFKVEQITTRCVYDKNQNCVLIHAVLYPAKSVILYVILATSCSFQQTGQKMTT
jgi:hypothetical protein